MTGNHQDRYYEELSRCDDGHGGLEAGALGIIRAIVDPRLYRVPDRLALVSNVIDAMDRVRATPRRIA